MPVRFAVWVLAASLVCSAIAPAAAQTWPPRLISRTVDVTRISTVDAVEFFSGEQVTYQIRGHSGSPTNYAALPTNAVGIWYATDDTYTNYFIVWTNSAQSNATGFMEFVLPTPYSALTAQTYESWVNVYGGTPTNGSTPIGVFDRVQIKVKKSASYAGTYRGPITYTNVTLDGNTYVAPGFWALHADDITDALTNLTATAVATTTAGFFEVYATSVVVNVGTNVDVWTVIPFSGTGLVFGFTVTNGVAYCATPGIYSVDAFGQLLVNGNPGTYYWAIFVNEDRLLDATRAGNTSFSYRDIKLGSLVTLTNGAALSTRMMVEDPDLNPDHAITFDHVVFRAVSTVSALASNVTVTIGGGSGTSTNVVFENLDGNGDVGTGSNQVARGSAVTDEATTRAAADTAIRGELGAASNALTTAVGTKIGASGVTFENADANGDIGTGSNQFARGSAVTDEATTRAAADTAIATTQTAVKATADAAAARLLALTNNLTFAGTTITNPCGVSIAMIYSGAASMQVTGCMAYLNIPDTNGPAAGGYVVVYNGATNSGSAIVFATGGSITNVFVANGQIVVQSKDETGGGGGGGDVYTTNNNVMAAGFTNITALGVMQFATNATDADRFGIESALWAGENALLVRNMGGGPRTDLTVVPGQGGTGTVAALKVTDALGPSNVTLVSRYNRGFSGTHTNGFAFSIKNSGGAPLQPLYFLMDESEVFHYGTDLKTRFQAELTVRNGGIGIGTTNLVGEQFRIEAANPFASIIATSASDYSVLNFRENGTQVAVMQVMGSALGGSLGAGTRANDMEIANVNGGDIVLGTGSGSWGTKFVVVSKTGSRLGVSYADPPEALCVSGNVVVAGSRQVNGIWQGNYLGVFTNQNPTKVIPGRQGDWYLDEGSNTMVVAFGFTTQTWHAVNFGAALLP